MKKILFFTLASAVLLTSCGQSDNSADIVSTSVPIEQAQQEIVAESPTVLAANYEEYNEGSLGEAENTVLFFHAPYCGSCTATDKSIKETWVSSDTKILKLDYDTETELAQKYGVTKYHTFVQVDANGNMIKKWNGSMSAADIQEQLSVESEEVMMEKEETVMEDKMEKSDDVMEKKEVMEDKMDKQELMEKEAMSDDKMEKWEVMEDKMEAKVEEVAAPVAALAGTYATYNSSLVGQTDKTVVFFHAGWCPSCVAADKNISASEVPEGLTVLKADFDSSTDLRKKYGVNSQHTFVQIDANGEMINKWSGGNSIDSIIERL